MPLKQKHKNRLTFIRKKNALEQKEIARLLGHQTTDQISRYERGIKLPNLKTALILQIIYHLPVHVLFYGCYESCLKELKKQKKYPLIRNNEMLPLPNNSEFLDEAEFCTFIENLRSTRVSDHDLDKARTHITELLKTRSKRMNNI